jgi:hypothetical protein
MLTKLVITGKEHMIPQLMMADCTTGQQQEQHNEELYNYALQRLDLTSEQQQRIQATLMCFQGLLAAIMEERQALQTQLFPNGMPSGPPGGSSSSGAGSAGPSPAAVPAAVGAAPMPAGPAGDNADANAANTVSNTVSNNARTADAGGASSAVPLQETVEEGSISRSGSGSGSDERSSNSRASDGHGSTKVALSQQQHARRELQQQHQQQLAQMFKLLKKESLLKCCCWVGVEGCMTYVQLAKLAVTCFPYPASPIALAQAVDRMLKQQPQQPAQTEQQQQQQHQQSVPSSM